MNTLRETTKPSLVKILITIPALIILMASVTAKAADDDDDGPRSKSSNSGASADAVAKCYSMPNPTDARIDSCMKAVKDVAAAGNSSSCASAEKRALDAKRNITKLCSEGGLGDKCYERAKLCADVARATDEPDSTSAIQSALSSLMGNTNVAPITPKKREPTGCPQYTYDGYTKRRKEINDELKQLKEDLNRSKTDAADLEKETQEDLKKTQEDLNTAQKDKQDALHDVDDDTRKQVSEASENQSKMKSALSATDLKIIELRGAIQASQADAADKLLQINTDAVKDTCMATYEERLNKYQSSKLKSSIGFGEMKRLKSALLASYTNCIKMYDQKRINLMTQKEQEQAELRQKINAAAGDMEETERSIDLAKNQLNEIQTAAAAKKKEAEANLLQKMQTANTSAATTAQNMQKRQATFQTKDSELQKRINELNTELSLMGDEPDPDATTTPRKVASQIKGEMAVITAFKEIKDPVACCPAGKGKRSSLCDEPDAYRKADPSDVDPALTK